MSQSHAVLAGFPCTSELTICKNTTLSSETRGECPIKRLRTSGNGGRGRRKIGFSITLCGVRNPFCLCMADVIGPECISQGQESLTPCYRPVFCTGTTEVACDQQCPSSLCNIFVQDHLADGFGADTDTDSGLQE